MIEKDYHREAQKCHSEVPSIILGSGASVAFGLPSMDELAEYLIERIKVSTMGDAEQLNWGKFSELLSEIGLEPALHKIHLGDALSEQVVLKTWELINPKDLCVFNKSLSNSDLFPLVKLLKHMFKSAVAEVNIITTNYDRLAEYACDQAHFHHYSGFSHGYLRRVVDRQCLRSNRRVNIWKVHGSLDWMRRREGDICALGQVTLIPEHFVPQIVMPGNGKYAITHGEPYRSIITQTDAVISKSNSYLCVGFGFNDEHIQPKLVEKCLRGNAFLTLITRDLTEAAKNLIFNSGVAQYLAICRDTEDNKSIIYSSSWEGPLMVDRDHWSLSGYLELIL